MSQVDINTTISALQQGLTSIPVKQAVTVIEGWQQQLQGNPIAEELGKLKTALTSGNATGASLAEALSAIGKSTTEAAQSADPSAAAKVKELGQLLSQAASSLK